MVPYEDADAVPDLDFWMLMAAPMKRVTWGALGDSPVHPLPCQSQGIPKKIRKVIEEKEEVDEEAKARGNKGKKMADEEAKARGNKGKKKEVGEEAKARGNKGKKKEVDEEAKARGNKGKKVGKQEQKQKRHEVKGTKKVIRQEMVKKEVTSKVMST